MLINAYICCRSTMSELFMECVEEDLEPWQKSVPQINLTEEDDDDDEPIFVGVVCMYKRYPNSGNVAQNGMSIFDCPNCKSVFSDEDGLKSHASNCKPSDVESSQQQSVGSKHIMLVGEFYYGKYEGDGYTNETEKATTFKCQSCLKVLKNNIRFMNHMKHHLELEKQNSESFESHTTCQHCYRQYLTPFQLQCHIESAHSAVESTTNCKICELAFETEQVLLDHMKNNHKPGEMPYVCQVCNFRSSFFSDVEAHFRNAHENAKDILCPFCLKVFKSGHIYMQHYMRHQKKGIFRCGKCRLNFLSFKEKVEHRTQVHRTFIKPKALEGLAPGTKVTIRASITGNPSVTPSSTTPFGFIVTSDKSQTSKSVNLQKSSMFPSVNSEPVKVTQKKQERGTSKNNFSLKNFRLVTEKSFFVYVIAFSSTVNDVLIYLFSRTGGKQYKCIECKGLVNDFFTHFPMILNCGACKYQTNCKESIGNHMIRFHSTVSKSRFLKFENRRCFSSLKLTLVCLKCDLLLDASTGDRMAKHLTNRPNHRCKVIQEKGTVHAWIVSTTDMLKYAYSFYCDNLRLYFILFFQIQCMKMFDRSTYIVVSFCLDTVNGCNCLFFRLPVQQPAETSTSTLVMMIVMPENKDETLSMKSLTAAADTNVDPSKPLQTSTSSGCEQENGSLDMATLKDSQESLRPDLSV
uniref:Zinc finger protein 280D n=1 Tax=Neogobius melanostomus TaxID=47308 RepID=A0A8C6UFX0_9GOBI